MKILKRLQQKETVLQLEDINKIPLIDSFLANPPWHLKFPKILENFFNKESASARCRHLLIAGFYALPVYNIFLIPDNYILGNNFYIALIAKLCIVNPLIILTMLNLLRNPAPVQRELIESFTIFTAGCSTIFLIWISEHPAAFIIHSGLMLVLIFANLVVRLPFWHGLSVSLLIFILYLISQIFKDNNYSLEIQIYNIAFISSAILFSLFSNYTFEKETRRSYLLSLRERIRTADLSDQNFQLSTLSMEDPLTGLPNRRFLDGYLKKLNAPNRNSDLAIIIFDIDYFKQYNDYYGHQEGDNCLIQISNIIKKSLRRAGDIVARIGGEEFLAVLPDTDLSNAQQVAERIRLNIRELAIPHNVLLKEKIVTVSGGIAIKNSQSTSPEELIKQADKALYRAKTNGRDQILS